MANREEAMRSWNARMKNPKNKCVLSGRYTGLLRFRACRHRAADNAKVRKTLLGKSIFKGEN